MSTRATYQFIDQYNDFTVYKHYDGYPEGAAQWIKKALENAWPLPRFEADEFAAAFIAANKDSGGDVRLTGGKDDHGDTEHHYVVTCVKGVLMVRHEDLNRWTSKIEEMPLDEFVKAYA